MTAGDPFGDAKASGFQIIRSPKGAAPQPPARSAPAPTSRPATDGPITPLDIVRWLREQGITPLPCRPKSKSPISQISRRGIYGDNAPAGDSFHVPTPERMAAVRVWWSNEDYHRQATVKDCSISVPLHPDWNSGRQVIVLDIDDVSLCDAVANAPALERCPVGTGKKGAKLFAFLDPDGGRPESPIVQYAPKDDPDHPALEIFTGSKHALIYGEHPDSTRERPILYAITRGFGEPFPVLTWEDIEKALEPIIQENGLVLKESGGAREPVDLVQAPRPRPRGGRTITDRINLSITDVCTITDGVRCGDEIRGSHPVHGSTTGQNFAINPHENTWHCFRCGTGGGPLEWIAVEAEIIDCSAVRPGCLHGHWREVFAVLRAKGYEVDSPEPEQPRREEPDALPPRDLFASVHPKSGAVSLIYTTIADWIIATLKTISYRRTIYVYDRGRGIYRENDGDIEQLVQEIADRCGFTGRISTAKREVISYILDQEIAREYPFNSYPGIPCANGVVVFDFETGTRSLVPHSPEYRFTYRLPVIYDPTADPTEIRQVLASWADEGAYEILLQIPAQAILQAALVRKPFKKSYIIHGDSNAGKSSYLELNRRTFGNENIARVMLQQFGSDRFCLANLEGKLFNIYDDLDDVPLQNSSVLKAITGDDMHYVEKKGRDAYEARIFCVHIFTCNRPPSTPERVQNDAAFWGRWEFITFPNYFEVNPKWHDEVFTPETCSAYFNLVLDVVASTYQTGRLPVNSSAYEVRDAWQTNSDPLYRFVTENMDRSEAGYVLKDDAYSGFLNFARTENVPPSKIPPTPETFAKAIFKYGFAPARVRVDGARVQVFRGYAWKSTSQYKPGGATNATLQGGA